MRRSSGERSTPEGRHLPVMPTETLAALELRAGKIVVDATLGGGGHSAAILERIMPGGRLLGVDLDPANLERTRARFADVAGDVRLVVGNFAGLDRLLGEAGIDAVDGLIADLGMSSLQLDDAERGFSFMRDGPLDMRMDPTRGVAAADVLGRLSKEELADALVEIGDEPAAQWIAEAIVRRRENGPIRSTRELAEIVLEAANPGLRVALNRFTSTPVARVFQTLRILVNRELGNLDRLLTILPGILKPGGRAAIISFHSGEDRLVKKAFRDGVRAGVYSRSSGDPLRPTEEEVGTNPRSRSAKLRWAERAG